MQIILFTCVESTIIKSGIKLLHIMYIFYLFKIFNQLYNKNTWLHNPSNLEDNARGQLIINSNSPSDYRGDGHTILVGVPKTTRQFNLTAWQQCVSKIITSEASPKKVPSSHRVRIEHVSWQM